MSFIKDKLIKDVAKRLDDVFKFKGVLELADGAVFKIALRMLNDKFADRIPVEYQDEVIVLLEAFANDDYSKVTEATVNAIDELVDLPVLNDEEEGILAAAVVQMLNKLIKRKKKR